MTITFCTNCQSEITTTNEPQRYRYRKTGRIFCSKTCGMAHREANRPPRKLAEPIAMTCSECGSPVHRSRQIMAQYRRNNRAFCSIKCSSAYRHRIASVTMAETNRKYARDRMITRNPMHSPETRAKVSVTLKQIKHAPRVRGGNGKPATHAEMMLALLLAPHGFVSQLVVPTRTGRAPWHYKIDIAHPVLKIAVEADGPSHGSLIRQESDRRKDEFLTGAGWKVFRFSNEEILKSPETVLFTISRSVISTPIPQTA